MEVYLLRHAEAGEAPRDEDRELTEHGREQARVVASGAAWLNLDIAAILSSPLPRAMQTAEPLAHALGLRVISTAALATGHGPAEALNVLDGYDDSALLVGHEPQLSGIVQSVTGGRVHMRKAMLARIEGVELDPPRGELAWLLSWRHLERLGR